MDKLVKKTINQTLLYSGIILSGLITPSIGLYVYAGTLPYPNPRTQIQGSSVSGENNFMGDIDSLLPLYGSTNRFLFADIAGRYGSHNYWFASPGGGFRGVYHNQLFGVYAFGDYQKTNPQTRFWIFNPGLEWMTPILDAHVNGYFPNRRQRKIGPTVFDSDLGNYNNVRFQEHTQFDLATTPIVAISRGVDAELGYSLDLQGYRARVYGGGYYYHSPVNEAQDIRGAFAGVQLPLNKFADVLVTNSYNNIDHNRVALTLRVTWDGDRTFSHDVEDRLLDRIERHSGIIQTAASSLTQKVLHRSEEVYRKNIWFFEPATPSFSLVAPLQVGQIATAKTFNSCTYEHPCNDFNQTSVTQINQLAPNANFYMRPGAYTLSNTSALTAYSGQSIYGRNSDYRRPALGTERAAFTGAVLAQGSNYFDSLQVSNNNIVTFNQLYFEHGIAALVVADTAGSRGVGINNSDFTVDTDTGTAIDSGYSSGVIAASGVITLDNSTLVSENSGTDLNNSVAYGLLVLNDAKVTGANNNISSTSAGRFAYGVAAFNTSKLHFNSTTINAKMTGIGIGDAHALHLRDFSQTEMNAINLNADSSGDFAVGVTTNQQSTLNLTNSTIVVNMTGSGTARAAYLRQLSTTKINNTSITANSIGATAYAVYSEQESVLNLNQSLLRSNGGATSSALGLLLKSKAKISGSQNSIHAESSGVVAVGATSQNESVLSLKDSTILANMTGGGNAQGFNINNYAQVSLDTMNITSNSLSGITFGALLVNSSKLQLNNSNITTNMTGGGEAQTIQIADSSQAKISNSKITANSTGTFSVAIRALTSGKFTLDNSTVIANNGNTGTSRGLQLENNTTGVMNQSSIIANASDDIAFGVLLTNSSNLQLNNSNVTANMTGGSEAQTIQIADSSQAKISNTKITANSTGTFSVALRTIASGKLTLDNSTLIANSGDAGTSRGLQLEGNAAVTVNQGTITANSSGSFTFGALAVGASKLTINNSTIVSNMTGQLGEAQGIQIAGTSLGTLTTTNVTATNINNNVYGALVLQNGILNLNQSNVVAQNTNPTQGHTFGLSNANTGSSINVTNSNLAVTGFAPVITVGPNIAFNGTNTCKLNGTTVTCN